MLVAVSAALLAACGGDGSTGEEAASRDTHPVRVVTADFPTRQRLGETSLLRLGVRNVGDEALPSLTVTVTVGGVEGRESKLPFGYRDPQSELAQPDRPVWVLSENYPRLAGAGESAGAGTANEKTFDFGRLPPDETAEIVWQVTAVKTGRFNLLYEVGAGRGAEAETPSGSEAGGSFAVRITEVPPETVVTDDGQVVPAPRDPTRANR